MENFPVRSARTSKSKVCTFWWGVAVPNPSCPVPLTRAPGTKHVTAMVAVPVPPAGTATVPAFPPLTVQFDATPDSATGLAPAGTVKVALPLLAIAWLVVPSTVTVYPSASGLEPVVLVVTVRAPLPEPIGLQLPEKVIDAVWPADTFTCCEFEPTSVQFPVTPERTTV